MTGMELLKYWVLFNVGAAMFSAAIMMWATGKMPPPFSKKKAPPELAALQFIVGMTIFLVYATPELFDTTYKFVLSLLGS